MLCEQNTRGTFSTLSQRWCNYAVAARLEEYVSAGGAVSAGAHILIVTATDTVFALFTALSCYDIRWSESN